MTLIKSVVLTEALTLVQLLTCVVLMWRKSTGGCPKQQPAIVLIVYNYQIFNYFENFRSTRASSEWIEGLFEQKQDFEELKPIMCDN